MEQIIDAFKVSSIEIKYLLETDLTLKSITNIHNKSGDDVKKLDLDANNIFHKNLDNCNHVYKYITEEDNEETLVNKQGTYYVSIDPLDGSSNIENNNIVGNIFCIFSLNYKKEVISGKNIMFAGYCLYGPKTHLVCCKRNTLPEIYQLINNNFICICKNIEMSVFGKYYCCNVNNINSLNTPFNRVYNSCIKGIRKVRWSGCMVADVHRILLDGGIFFYPSTKKTPNGKLRLLYECYPMAFIIENAGGYSYNENLKSILDIEFPKDNLHKTIPIILSSLVESKFIFT
tara:strand:- start:5375 stop:6238 length:864 start_codon:yes stop_codon:yes gene_type:complete